MDFYMNLLTIVISYFVFRADAGEIQAEILKGVTVRNWPFADRLSGKYEGFAIDVMNEIADIVGFEYRLYFSPDGKYGAVQDNRVNGMIGEVYTQRADFAIADITVTDVRKKFVDFTEPIMETGIAVLIHKNNAKNIRSFRDLAEQTDVKYGTYRMGSTYNLFSLSTDPTIRKMYLEMSKNSDVLVNNAKEGVDKVNSTKYAFIVESSFAEFLSGMYCDLTFIEDKNNYFPRQYAIAMPKDSIYTPKFNSAIRKLKANGQLNRLKARYWRDRCEQNNKDNNNSSDIDKREKTNIRWADKGYDVSAAHLLSSYNNNLIVLLTFVFYSFAKN